MHTNFINEIITPNFLPIASCVMMNDVKWRFVKDSSYNSTKDTSNWVYVFLVGLDNAVELVKIGGTGASNGIQSRMQSYQSGNPEYNEKNGPQNRACYQRIIELLRVGANVQLFGYRIPPIEVVIKMDMPWNPTDTTALVSDIQLYKPYEKNLISTFESVFGQKPKWNRNAN